MGFIALTKPLCDLLNKNAELFDFFFFLQWQESNIGPHMQSSCSISLSHILGPQLELCSFKRQKREKKKKKTAVYITCFNFPLSLRGISNLRWEREGERRGEKGQTQGAREGRDGIKKERKRNQSSFGI